MSAIFRRIFFYPGCPILGSSWYLLIIHFFSFFSLMIFFPRYFHLLLFHFFISVIFIKRWYSCCFAFFRFMFWRNIFLSSIISASAMTLFFLFWYFKRNDMFCTSSIHLVYCGFVICTFRKYIRFLWSMTITLSIVFSSRYLHHFFIIISISFSIIV